MWLLMVYWAIYECLFWYWWARFFVDIARALNNRKPIRWLGKLGYTWSFKPWHWAFDANLWCQKQAAKWDWLFES